MEEEVHQLRRKVVFSVWYDDAARVRAAARLRERRAATSMVICARERMRREREPAMHGDREMCSHRRCLMDDTLLTTSMRPPENSAN